MRLTPLDIRHKEFSRAMRGYKDLEVDEFLDDIADEFERVFNENIDHREKLETLEEKNEQYRNIEDTLKKTLLSAQQQADEMKQNAKKEADLILRDAELKSRTIINDSYAERQKIQRSVSALKQKNEDLRYQLRSVIETYSNILDQDDLGTIEEEDLGPIFEPAPEAISDETMVGGIDNAVSSELLKEETAHEPVAAYTGSDEIADVADRDESRPADIPPTNEAARSAGEKEDPFADLDTDKDDHKFNW